MFDEHHFRDELFALGVVSWSRQSDLLRIAVQCSRTQGLAEAIHQAEASPGAQGVLVAGVGPLPGSVARTLVGLVSGQLGSDRLSYGARAEIRRFAE